MIVHLSRWPIARSRGPHLGQCSKYWGLKTDRLDEAPLKIDASKSFRKLYQFQNVARKCMQCSPFFRSGSRFSRKQKRSLSVGNMVHRPDPPNWRQYVGILTLIFVVTAWIADLALCLETRSGTPDGSEEWGYAEVREGEGFAMASIN
jgi:hypothetical protein